MFGVETMCCTITTLSWIAGIYTMIHTSICFGFWVFKNYIRKPHDLEKRYGKGSWVVVTGPTAGIGEAFAIEFARFGFNIVLIGRNKEKLVKTEQYVKDLQKSAKVRIVEADFSESIEPEFYEKIYSQIEDLDISILVNNAGAGANSLYVNYPTEDVISYINTNCGAPAMLSHVLIDKLRARKQQTAIINISSVACISPTPCYGVYPSTKAFLTFLSHGLSMLYKKEKVDVLNVIPGFVTTKMTENKTGPDTCSPKECVRNSLASLGYDFEVAPFWAHVALGQFLYVIYRFVRPVWSMFCKEFMFQSYQKYYEKSHGMDWEKKEQ